MGSPAAPSPYQQVTSTEEMPKWKKELLGFTPNAPEYSPFKALSRQAGTQAKMIEGMTSRPSWSSMYEAYGVKPGTDLTPYIQATRQGTQGPMAPIPASPAAGDIPEFIPPSEEAKKKKAMQGGLMSLRKGYAPGGAVKPKYTAKTSAQDKYSALQDALNDGYKPKPAELQFMQAMTDNQSAISSLKDTPYSIDAKTGAIKPVSRGATQSSSDYTNYLNKLSGAGVGVDPKVVKQYNVQTPSAIDKGAPPAVPLSQAMDVVTPFYDPTGQAYNTAAALQQKKASGQKLSDTEEATLASSGSMLDPYGGVTNPVYRQALDQLRAASNAPETIGQGAGIMSQAAKDLMKQAGYTPQQINAAELQGTAAQMSPYEKVTGKDVAASSISRGDVRDVNAQMAEVERYKAAMMQAPTEANVENYNAAQAQLNQMQGPKSWTDQGTAAQYMSPYMQNVVDIQKRESMRDFGKQMAQLNAQAAGMGAYGGSRQAIERSEARRNQAQRMADIEAQGLQQAYQSGMGQFSAEQGLGLQAGQANLSAAQQTALANQAATNQQRTQFVNNALQAAMQSYGGQLTAEQQNQVAANAASQFNSQSQNQAYNNYVAQQLAAQQGNQQIDYNTAMQNAQLAQQAALANQQYGVGGFQSQQLNQQAGLTTEQQNAQLRQQMGLANQQVGLQAAIQNQQAGLTGQGLNLQALNQAGQMGQGLGALGNQTWGNQQNVSQLWGAAGQTVQNLAQQAANAKQQTGVNWWGGMGNAYQPVTNLITGTPGATVTQNTNRTPS